MFPIVSSSNQTFSQRSNTCVVTAPTGILVDDILIAHIVDFENFTDGLQTITVPSGWTIIDTFDNTSTSLYVRSIVAIKRAVLADTTAPSYTFSVPSTLSLTDICASVSLLKYVNAGGQPGQHNNISVGVTPSRANSLLLALLIRTGTGSGTNTSSAFAVGVSNPSWNIAYDNTYTDGAVGCYPYFVLVSAVRSAVTATGAFTYTSSLPVNVSLGHLLSINPATFITITETLNHTEIAKTAIAVIITDTLNHTEDVSVVPSKNWNDDSKPTTVWVDDIK